MRIKPVNPVAKALAQARRRATTVPPKKGKGSYNRNKEKRNNANQAGKNEGTQD